MKRMILRILILGLFVILLSNCATTQKNSGNFGISFENAVIIKANNEDSGLKAEYNWLKANCPGCKIKEQSLAYHNDKPYDIFTITTTSGMEMKIYFDISNFFGIW